MKRISLVMAVLIFIIVLSGCNNDAGKIVDGYTQAGNLKLEQIQMPKNGEEIAIITTNMGVIKLRLFPEVAPKAVKNFKTLVREGFYDGVKFTRIEENFLIQIDNHPEYPEGKSIYGEFYEDEYDLNYRNITGAVGLAKREENKNHSNFYIIVQDGIDEEYIEAMKEYDEEGYPKDVIRAYETLGGVPRLDLRYTVFAQVFYGLDTVRAINKVDVIPGTSEPSEDVYIEKVEIDVYEGK